MSDELRNALKIPHERLDEINAILLDPNTRVVNDFLDVVAKYGSPEEINRKAAEAGRLDHLLAKVKERAPQYMEDLDWLKARRDEGAFISVADYRRKILGDKADSTDFNEDSAVTLEVSACQYFPWIRAAAERALEEGTLMPGRFIKVRKMKEQEEDGDHQGKDSGGLSYSLTDKHGLDHVSGPFGPGPARSVGQASDITFTYSGPDGPETHGHTSAQKGGAAD